MHRCRLRRSRQRRLGQRALRRPRRRARRWWDGLWRNGLGEVARSRRRRLLWRRQGRFETRQRRRGLRRRLFGLRRFRRLRLDEGLLRHLTGLFFRGCRLGRPGWRRLRSSLVVGRLGGGTRWRRAGIDRDHDGVLGRFSGPERRRPPQRRSRQAMERQRQGDCRRRHSAGSRIKDADGVGHNGLFYVPTRLATSRSARPASPSTAAPEVQRQEEGVWRGRDVLRERRVRPGLANQVQGRVVERLDAAGMNQ